ncbi:MAG: DNA repair protein RadA [Gammaproteobacteria bacterium]|nr:DNA repair protein RadA [Gammaproteobacteria bacterium]
MAKTKSIYVCGACGAQSLQWAGQCPECEGWNTLSEARVPAKTPARTPAGSGKADLHLLSDIKAETEARNSTAITEFDRVLGGGLVRGSVTLLGGDPGIGKSTLLLQMADKVAQELRVLYVSGEESPQQVSLRAKRLGLKTAGINVMAETCVETVVETAVSVRPDILVVDSIQTIYSSELSSAPGAVGQLRESSAQLVKLAKQAGIAVIIVGHVTKEGVIAGPRVLEHMVDTVLYFETDVGSRYRVVRAIKNRFGAVNELGIFAMTEKGLKEVKNPSAIFLSRHEMPVSGSVVTVIREGSRPILVEIQALVDPSQLSNPRRVTVGLEANRLSMLLAVLHRHGGIALYDQDVFVNVVGGLRANETGVDLAVGMAILSSLQNLNIAGDLIIFGEVGLAGEVRPVHNGEERLQAAAKHGFKKAIVPAANVGKNLKVPGLELVPVNRVADAISEVFG